METKVEAADVAMEMHADADGECDTMTKIWKENMRLQQQVKTLQTLLLSPPSQGAVGPAKHSKNRRLSAPAHCLASLPESHEVNQTMSSGDETLVHCCENEIAQHNFRSGRPSLVPAVDCCQRERKISTTPQVDCGMFDLAAPSDFSEDETYWALLHSTGDNVGSEINPEISRSFNAATENMHAAVGNADYELSSKSKVSREQCGVCPMQ